jgi:hypothetical protein
MMGQSEKCRVLLKDGSLSKKPKSAFEVDHIDGNHELLSLDDLGKYAKTLLLGDMRILCYSCHQKVTHGRKDENYVVE